MVTAVAFPPDGSLLVTCSRDKSVRFWAMSWGRGVVSRKTPGGHVRRVGVAAAMHAPSVPLGSEEPLELTNFSAVEGRGRVGLGAALELDAEREVGVEGGGVLEGEAGLEGEQSDSGGVRMECESAAWRGVGWWSRTFGLPLRVW